MNDYSQLRRIPLLRILFPFVLGIVFAVIFLSFLNRYIWGFYGLVIVLLTVAIIVLFNSQRNKLFDYLLMPILFLIGSIYAFTSLKTPPIELQERMYRGFICEDIQLKKNSTCLTIQLDRNQFQGKFYMHEPRMLLYTNRDSLFSDSIRIGDEVIFYARLDSIKNLGNPGEFDFKKYLSTKFIAFQTYVPIFKLKIVKTENQKIINRFASNVRSKIILQLHEYPFSKNTFAILLALTAGNREFVSDELERSYINAGVVHVLSVSGLHVGIIYMFLQILLKFLDYHKRTRILKVAIIIIMIWIYALISGLSPSVMRAALMFSLIAFGKSIQRDISSFNILALAALIMLVINPLQIFDVGFQLSYLAVFGILYFQPIFDSWYTAKNKIVDYIYKLFTVSMAAQLSTIPLTLFYFNQFPSYFWLANFLVIPISFIILILAIVFLIFSGIPLIAGGLGWLLNITTCTMNGWIVLVENLPGSVIKGINFPVFQVILSFGFIFYLFGWIKKPRISRLYFVFLLLIGYLINGIIQKYKPVDDNMIVVYNTPKYTSIVVFSDKQNYIIANYNGDSIPANIQSMYKRHWQVEDIQRRMVYIPLDSLSVSTNKAYIKNEISITTINYSTDKTILFYPGNRYDKQIMDIEAEFLIVSKNCFPPQRTLKAKSIILDSSNKPYIEHFWISYCQKWSKNLVVIRKQGAYTIKTG